MKGPTRTQQTAHRRFLSRSQSAIDMQPQGQVITSSSAPFLQRLAEHFRRGSTGSPKRNWAQMFMMTPSSDATPSLHDSLVSGEFDQDMARAVIAVSARMLGMDPTHLSSSPGLLHLVARNMQWFHHTPDMFKLAGLVVAKKLNSIIVPSEQTTIATSSPMMTEDTTTIIVPVVAEEPQPEVVPQTEQENTAEAPSTVEAPAHREGGDDNDESWINIEVAPPMPPKKRRRTRQPSLNTPPVEEAIILEPFGTETNSAVKANDTVA